MDCNLPGPSVHISQARILKWVPISFFRGSSWPRGQNCISSMAAGFFTTEPPPGKKYTNISVYVYVHKGFLVAQLIKNPPTIWETWVQSLGQEEPLEKEMATIPVFLSGKSHGWRSLAGYSPWVSKNQIGLSNSIFTFHIYNSTWLHRSSHIFYYLFIYLYYLFIIYYLFILVAIYFIRIKLT